MIPGNNTKEIYLGSMDDEEFHPQAVAVFLGFHLTNVTRALRRKGENKQVSQI